MKKTILVMLMVLMISTPCLAEVEPDGLFSIEKTLWESDRSYYGFYQGTVYRCNYDMGAFLCSEMDNSFYIDLFLVSIFTGTFNSSGILFPLSGIGVLYDSISIRLLSKVDDDWIP